MKLRLFILCVLVHLGACSEGGIGGTGGIVPPSTPQPVSMSGQANKGPFAEGSTVSLQTIDSDGSLGASGSSTAVTGLGDFTVSSDPGTVQLITVSGSYFSEDRGVFTAESLSIRGVSPAGRSPANVNIATHLIHQRVMGLIAGGMGAGEAIDMAEDELTLALSPLLPVPASSIDFSNLLVINALDASVNAEGNAWLLVSGSLFERYAIERSESMGGTASEHLSEILDDLAEELRAGGSLVLGDRLDELIGARSALDPDRIHQNLLFVDESLRSSALAASGQVTQTEAEAFACGVFGNEIVCAQQDEGDAGGPADILAVLPADDSVQRVSIALGDVVADMNLFLDTDGDGVVNADDEDDDGDGIPDEMDDEPFGG